MKIILVKSETFMSPATLIGIRAKLQERMYGFV